MTTFISGVSLGTTGASFLDVTNLATKTYACDLCKDDTRNRRNGEKTTFETAIELAQHMMVYHPEALRPKVDVENPVDLTEAVLEAMD